MRVAVVHDWLVTYAGAERVLHQILNCFPKADLFCTVDFLSDSDRQYIHNKKATTSFIQKLPSAKHKYRNYLPLMPLAVEQFDLSSYDLIISSSHAVAKGVLTGPDQLHICMCYSPIRYAWDLQHQYLYESKLNQGLKGWVAKYFLHKMRIWDARTSNGVDQFIAISNYIQRRIMKSYRRDSKVIYPPVDVSNFTFQEEKSDYYFTASRMVPYKKISTIIEAFAEMKDKKLIVIGDGPEFPKCKSVAAENVVLMGWQPFNVLKHHMQNAKAFIFAAEEDFGIAPLEAQACGTPVIAFGKGAALETIKGLTDLQPTGLFFENQTKESLIEGVKSFERNSHLIKPASCRQNALRFSPENFRKELFNFVTIEFNLFKSKCNRDY